MIEDFKQLIFSLDDPATIIDKDYRYLCANTAYLRLRGQDEEQLIGKHLADIVGEERFQLEKPCIDSALAGDTGARSLIDFNDGEKYLYLEVVHRRIRDPEKDEWMVFSVTHDCTESILARRQVDLFKNVISSSTEMICVVNEDLKSY